MKIENLIIDDLGANGEGIAHDNGRTVFLPFALPKERVTATIVHEKRGVAFAELQEVLEPSADRVAPRCPVFGVCGGCDLQHMAYAAQLEMKRENLRRIFKKNGVDFSEIAPVVPSKPYEYRNKIQLPFGVANGKVALGFFRENTHEVVPIDRCPLHGDWAEKLIRLTSEFFCVRKTRVYTEKCRDGLLRHLAARNLNGKLAVTLVVTKEHPDFEKAYADALQAEFPDCVLYINVNRKANNVILGEKSYLVTSDATAEIDGVKLKVNPHSFFQVNDEIRKRIYEDTVKLLRASHAAVVIDAYAGIGLLGIELVKSGARIYNLEIVPEATADGKRLYEDNGFGDSASFYTGDAAVLLPKVLEEISKEEKTAIVLDPPRKGISEEVAETLLTLNQKDLTLIYISCNPATLTRDLARLSKAYQIESVTPYDMFPNTRHMETLVQLSHKNPNSHIVVKVEFDEGKDTLSPKNLLEKAKSINQKKE